MIFSCEKIEGVLSGNILEFEWHFRDSSILNVFCMSELFVITKQWYDVIILYLQLEEQPINLTRNI